MDSSGRVNTEEIILSFDGSCEMSEDVMRAMLALRTQPEQLRSFRPRAIASTALAAASLSPVDGKLLGAVSKQVADLDSSALGAFEPADLTALAWALACAGHKDVPTMTAIGWQLADRAWEFSPEQLAKTVLAFAELRLAHQAMMATISMEVMWKIDQFSPRSLAQIAESCARLGYCKEPVFDWLAARVIGRLDDYSFEDLAAIMWSFAQASFRHTALFDTIAGRVASAWPDLEERLLSRFVWAFGKLGVAHHGLMTPLYHPRLSGGPG